MIIRILDFNELNETNAKKVVEGHVEIPVYVGTLDRIQPVCYWVDM